MSTNLVNNTRLFSVHGRMFDATSRKALGNLLVTVYGVTKPDGWSSASKLAKLLKHSTRIGSVVSDQGGTFVFSYDSDAAAGADRLLNLLIVVSAPGDESAPEGDRVIYYTTPPRMNAGRIEHFSVGPET